MSPSPDKKIANIWAVGRNYADHAKELNNPVPESKEDPLIFLKAGSSVVENQGTIQLPSFSQDIHHECEIAFRFGPKLKLTEMTLALDLTARDIQSKLKEKQQPWTLAKSFKASCPVGPFVEIPSGLNFESIQFTFKINGDLRQSGHSGDMIHSISKLRDYVVSRFPVVEGDLLLTGTPKGVGLIRPGDNLEAEISGVLKANWLVANWPAAT